MLDKVALFMPSLKSNFILTYSIERRTGGPSLNLPGRRSHDKRDPIFWYGLYLLPTPLSTDLSNNGINLSRLELPISDESNDDFNLEVLPGERPKKGPDFDIPIVINEKVEHFIQYFQTTAKNHFSQ